MLTMDELRCVGIDLYGFGSTSASYTRYKSHTLSLARAGKRWRP